MTNTDGLTAAAYSHVWEEKKPSGQQSETALRVTRQEVAEKQDNAGAIGKFYTLRNMRAILVIVVLVGHIIGCTVHMFRCSDDDSRNQPTYESQHCLLIPLHKAILGLESLIHRRPKVRRTLDIVNQ